MPDEPRDIPLPEVQHLLKDLLGRVQDLEQQVAALKTGRPSLASVVPYTPPTEEELHDMLHGPRGQSLLGVIEEYEKKYPGE
jgi:hypothetical protein